MLKLINRNDLKDVRWHWVHHQRFLALARQPFLANGALLNQHSNVIGDPGPVHCLLRAPFCSHDPLLSRVKFGKNVAAQCEGNDNTRIVQDEATVC
jgi:hypothetical protein